jgi:putative isomerase
LVADQKWFFGSFQEHRDRDGDGLLEWNTDNDPVCHCAESGMDNSPRFDGARQLAAVDFNCYVARECEALAGFADALGRHADAFEWRAHHRRLCQLINDRLWSEEHQFYCDYDPARGSLTPVLSSAGFLPLLCGAATPERAGRLVQHLADPTMFGTAVPVASIAARDVEHYSKDLCRGPVWVNMNWLIVQGLERYGESDAAERLRQATMAEVERCCEAYGTFFEYFDDRSEIDPPQLLRKGRCAPDASPYHQVVHEFGWTATLYADLVARAPQPRPAADRDTVGARLAATR